MQQYNIMEPIAIKAFCYVKSGSRVDKKVIESIEVLFIQSSMCSSLKDFPSCTLRLTRFFQIYAEAAALWAARFYWQAIEDQHRSKEIAH